MKNKLKVKTKKSVSQDEMIGTVDGSAPMAAQEPEGVDDYKVEDALRTLLQGEEHKEDKPLMAKVMEKLKRKQRAIKSLSDLKSVAHDRIGELQQKDKL